MDPALIVSLGAFGVAATALYVNVREHRIFMREFTARARFNVTAQTIGADDDGVLRLGGTHGTVRVAIEIDNEGEKAAGETLLEVLVPKPLDVEWCGPNGGPVVDRSASNEKAPTDETLNARGQTFEAHYLSRTARRISRRPVYAFYIRFSTAIPEPGEHDPRIAMPISIRVQADEIPDEINEYVVEHLVEVAPARQTSAIESGAKPR